jgi:hypothetical protein
LGQQVSHAGPAEGPGSPAAGGLSGRPDWG